MWFRQLGLRYKLLAKKSYKGISKNPYYLFGLTFNSSPLERKRRVFRDAHKAYCFL